MGSGAARVRYLGLTGKSCMLDPRARHHSSSKSWEMTDKEQFALFFSEMGVPFGEHDRSGWTFFDSPAPPEWAYVIGVGQAFFLFDEEGEYLGVAQDDPYEFFPRKGAS